eukprot:4951513-Amphidinium_carterae.1
MSACKTQSTLPGQTQTKQDGQIACGSVLTLCAAFSSETSAEKAEQLPKTILRCCHPTGVHYLNTVPFQTMTSSTATCQSNIFKNLEGVMKR